MALLEEMIVQGDVSFKISYVVQDDIQSFTGEIRQLCTRLLPTIKRKADGTLQHSLTYPND